ncbi:MULTISPECIES: Wzz/FepE/Etk N-terminal domain-containing protein [unclassified Alteromonas]|uniref:Wzz/FepE/Etk N-terminal domain-containing protein n=1 Tax=unclassified Alteromonas TaxID=2614992 RepID=UPI000509FEE3|nr:MULTISPECIES: Wzz/FepE/Etk N-terminal domain-containing protein [unclassified Alteromonas]
MTGDSLKKTREGEGDIDITELFMSVWRGKWLVIVASVIAGFVGMLYSLGLPNEYKSEVLLAPAEDANGGGLSALAGQLGGLASLAGVNLSEGKSDKITIALELLRSKAFIGEFVQSENLKPEIIAVQGWNSGSNKLSFDSDIYDKDAERWVRKVNFPYLPEPSTQEVHKKFVEELLSISKDKETGFVRVSITHYSPYVAHQIVKDLIEALNAKMRQLDILEAERSIEYLTSTLEETNVADMQQVFYQLIEKQQQTKMLANVRDEYVFKVIDPAVVPEKKSGPKRALICLLLVTSAFLVSCLVLIVRDQVKKSRK